MKKLLALLICITLTACASGQTDNPDSATAPLTETRDSVEGTYLTDFRIMKIAIVDAYTANYPDADEPHIMDEVHRDFDGDGNIEMFAICGEKVTGKQGSNYGEIWFASDSTVEKICDTAKYLPLTVKDEETPWSVSIENYDGDLLRYQVEDGLPVLKSKSDRNYDHTDSLNTAPPTASSSEEQTLGEKILAAYKEENPESEVYALQSPLYGDFDDDGINEMIAVCGDKSEAIFDDCYGSIWLATADEVVSLDFEYEYLPPEIIEWQDYTFIKLERVYFSDSMSDYYRLQNSTAEWCMIDGFAFQGLRPDNVTGEFAAAHSTYDVSSDTAGHTRKSYYYSYNGENNTFTQYVGTEITLDELLEIDGAEEIISAVPEEQEIAEIYRRDNGIINVNLREYAEGYEDINGNPAYINSFLTLMYDGERVTDITPEYNEGFYLP